MIADAGYERWAKVADMLSTSIADRDAIAHRPTVDSAIVVVDAAHRICHAHCDILPYRELDVGRTAMANNAWTGRAYAGADQLAAGATLRSGSNWCSVDQNSDELFERGAPLRLSGVSRAKRGGAGVTDVLSHSALQ